MMTTDERAPPSKRNRHFGKEWQEKAAELAATPRFKGKPMSLASHLGTLGCVVKWRYLVPFLADRGLLNKEAYDTTTSRGICD